MNRLIKASSYTSSISHKAAFWNVSSLHGVAARDTTASISIYCLLWSFHMLNSFRKACIRILNADILNMDFVAIVVLNTGKRLKGRRLNVFKHLHHKDLCLAVCKGEGWWILVREDPSESAGHLWGTGFHPLLELMPWKNIQIIKYQTLMGKVL